MITETSERRKRMDICEDYCCAVLVVLDERSRRSDAKLAGNESQAINELTRSHAAFGYYTTFRTHFSTPLIALIFGILFLY